MTTNCKLTVKCEGKHVAVNLSMVDITFDAVFTVAAIDNELRVVVSHRHHTRWHQSSTNTLLLSLFNYLVYM